MQVKDEVPLSHAKNPWGKGGKSFKSGLGAVLGKEGSDYLFEALC